jgi:hypothetical protein
LCLRKATLNSVPILARTDGEAPGEPGDRSDAGRLRLDGGTACLQFDSGAAVELVGPAEATVINADKLALTQGKVTIDTAAAVPSRGKRCFATSS